MPARLTAINRCFLLFSAKILKKAQLNLVKHSENVALLHVISSRPPHWYLNRGGCTTTRMSTPAILLALIKRLPLEVSACKGRIIGFYMCRRCLE